MAGAQTVDSGFFEVPINQPLPRVIKRGRNYDAGQGNYTDPVYGSTNDDIIFHTPDDSKWKVAALQLGIDIEIFEDVIGSA